MAAPIYLDYNATAPTRPEASDAVLHALKTGGNPSSVHAAGRAARKILEDARAAVATLAGATPAEVIFTAGATEANNLALTGLRADRVLVSAIEHDSVLAARSDAICVPVGRTGTIDLAALESELRPGDLVAVMAVNNETGIAQPLDEVARLVAEAGAKLHVDAVQGAGRIDLDFHGLGVSAMSLSAHKIGGPPGVGALIVADGQPLEPGIRGGGQERRRRAGTENLPGIAGFGAAAAAVTAERATEMPRLEGLRARLEEGLADIAPAAMIVGADSARVPNTCCVALPGLESEKQVMTLDLAGIAVSAGSACSSGKVAKSHVLSAMGLGDAVAGSAIRVSMGWATREDDIDRFLVAYAKLAAKAAA